MSGLSVFDPGEKQDEFIIFCISNWADDGDFSDGFEFKRVGNIVEIRFNYYRGSFIKEGVISKDSTELESEFQLFLISETIEE
jgi:hypothetical protein